MHRICYYFCGSKAWMISETHLELENSPFSQRNTIQKWMGELPLDKKNRLEPKSCWQIREAKRRVGWFSVDFQGTNSNSPVEVSAYGHQHGCFILGSWPSNWCSFAPFYSPEIVGIQTLTLAPCIWGWPQICDSWGRSIAPWRTTSVRPPGGAAWPGGSRRARSSAGLSEAMRSGEEIMELELVPWKPWMAETQGLGKP